MRYYSSVHLPLLWRCILLGILGSFCLSPVIDAKPAYPVIFIHGFKSDASTWDSMHNDLITAGWVFGGIPILNEFTQNIDGVSAGDFYRMNFSDSLDPSHPAQRLHLVQRAYEIGLAIRAVLKANPSYKKVILVGHSMGGLAARAYVQNTANLYPNGGIVLPYNNDVAELITVGTPHLGARLAAVCQAVGELCAWAQIDPNSISLDELRPDSSAVVALEDLIDNPLPIGIAYHSIVGVGRNTIGTLNEDGDGIVSAVSQNLQSLVTSFNSDSENVFLVPSSNCNYKMLQSHTCETQDYGIRAAIVHQFNVIAGPPLVTTNMASAVTQESVALNLQVIPNRAPTSIWFDWGKNTALGSQTVQKGIGTGVNSISASVTLGGLQCGTTYYFRARARNSIDTAVPGQTLSFSTASCNTGGGGETSNSLLTNGDFEQGSSGWTVLSGDWHISPPSPVTPHSGTHEIYLSTATGGMGNNLTGRFYSSPINVPSNATSGQYSFWLNVITTEPSSSTGVDLLHFTVVDASTFSPIVSSWLSNQNNTGGSYAFVPFLMDSSLPGRSVRLVFDGATNQVNPTLFALDDISFTVNVPATTAGAPSVSTQDSDEVTPSSARVSMAVNPNSADTTVWFNFEAENPSPVTETDHMSIGAGQQNVNFSFGVFDLQCDTVYYYRANARNSYGSRQGLVFSFRTDTCPAQPPAARTNSADMVTSSSARLNGAVNPNGFSTAAWFVWGADTVSTNSTPIQDVGTDDYSVNIVATVNNLQCGTTYYYRTVAQNGGGSDTGATYNFTTSPCSPTNVPPAISVTAPSAIGATADQSFVIGWNDSDPDNNATITLYYSLHSDCSSPVQIVGNISEDDSANTYTWDTSILPVDGYYILARISDDANPAASSCSNGHVSVSHTMTPNQIFKDGFEVGSLATWSSMLAHQLVGVWQGTIAGYASTLTIAQDTSGQFSAQVSMAQANQPVEALTVVSVTQTSFDALRPGDHNAELRLSLTQSGGQQCLTGEYLDGGTSRPISLCKTQ